jgi:hypothetical protein
MEQAAAWHLAGGLVDGVTWSVSRAFRTITADSTERDLSQTLFSRTEPPGPGWVNTPGRGNLRDLRCLVPGMRLISEAHMPQPGLAVVDVAVCDHQTAFAVQELLAGRWATASADGTTRGPGEPGVRLRCYLDVRQELRSLWRVLNCGGVGVAAWEHVRGSAPNTGGADPLSLLLADRFRKRSVRSASRAALGHAHASQADGRDLQALAERAH